MTAPGLRRCPLRPGAEHLLRLRMSMGSERPRFMALAPEAQAACEADLP